MPRSESARNRHAFATCPRRRTLWLVGDELRARAADEPFPRLSVVRSFNDAKAGVATLAGGVPVVFVFRCDDPNRSRVLDVLTGWSIGTGGSLDRIGPNTVSASPAGTGPVALARSGVVSVLDEVFADADVRLTRDEEERLLPLAAAGAVEAQRRLLDGYGELATVIALWLRPSTMSAAHAVALAQEELDRLVRWPPRRGTLLAALFRRLESLLA